MVLVETARLPLHRSSHRELFIDDSLVGVSIAIVDRRASSVRIHCRRSPLWSPACGAGS